MNQQVFQELFSDFDPGAAVASIAEFLKEARQQQFVSRDFVLGLSGGVDSAVAAALITNAEIPLHVMLLPDGFDPDTDSIVKAKMILKHLQTPVEYVWAQDLKPILDARCALCNFKPYPDCGKNLCRGNRAARQRMVELYDFARERGIVCGTENLTEYYLGYFTLHGDAATDIEPIHGLFKTEVRMLARHLGIPEAIITQAPTAGLWSGQTDEGEFGFSYEVADAVLKTQGDAKWIKRLEITREEMLKVILRGKNTEFKRRQRPVWNYPGRDLGWK